MICMAPRKTSIRSSWVHAFRPETLGNLYRDQCRAAGLPHCTLQGIRRGQATAIAHAGGPSSRS
ncbi:hypothetical protein CCR87_07690 [Rhodobaculum claviforme]|uniref:Uncharacterized protein n=1 Tax=Rhodobaculum claviforme TaxID=1549854 RepID=A0A934TL80_9RHOB|nr:hypothetical protein [Rhodobaculum claviforme]